MAGLLQGVRALAARALALFRRKPRPKRVTTISTVVVDPPSSASAFLCRWPQPYEVGDDTLAWFVTTGGITRQVQRDRLTDNVYTAQVLVAAGTTSFTVFTGADTSPATGWTAPTLDQLGLQFTGFEAGDKSIHKADFLDTTTQETPRDGHVERTIYRYMMTKVSHVGDATGISFGDGIACCHVWIHYRADNPNILEVEFDISNGAAEVETDAAKVAARGGGLKVETAPTTFGFLFCDPIIPTGWTLVSQDRPLVETGTALPLTVAGYISNAHCLPKRMGTSRRWVLANNSAGAAAVTAATETGQLLGLGRASYVSGQKSYHTVRAFGPTLSMLPDLATAYTGGYAQATADCLPIANALRTIAAAGTAGTFTSPPGGSLVTEFGTAPQTARLGLLHPAGDLQESTQGGQDIEVFAGARLHVRDYVRHAFLYSSMRLDGSGVRLFERTTGKHLTNKHFTDAYAGGAVGYVGVGVAGQRPFAFETDQNSGGEYRASRQQTFAGLIPRVQSWPPHFKATSGLGNGDDRWWPEVPGNWGAPSKSLWAFQCNYRPLLEQIPVWGGNSLGGKPIYAGGIAGTYAHLESSPTVSQQSGVCWRDNEDDQHAIRMYGKLIPAIWLGCDLLSIHLLKSVSNWYGWRWGESDTVPTGDTNLDNFCLTRRLALQASPFPNAARISVGRGGAWAMYIAAAHCAVADSTERDLGYSQGRGLRSRCEKFFDFMRLGIITQSGMTFIGGDPGGTSHPYVGGGDGGTIPVTYGVFQSALELPKVYAGFWSLLKQLEPGLPAASINHAKQLLLQGFNDYVARTNLYSLVGAGPSRGPAAFVATWTNLVGPSAGGSPVTGSDPNAAILRGPPGAAGAHWDDCSFIVEIAYRISGDASTFRPVNSLGQQQPPGTDPLVKAGVFLNATSAYSPGLVAMIQRRPGPDGGTVTPPSTNPIVVPTAAQNPVPVGATVKFFATVTPGTNPTSTGLAVTIDFSPLGIVDPVYDMLDDGIAPDVTAGDHIFTTELDTTSLAPGRYSFAVRVGDAQGRRSTVQLPFSLSNAITDPTLASITVEPSAVSAGDGIVIRAVVVLGSSPPSTGVAVTADLSSFGGSASAPLLDDGNPPDTTASDNEYALGYTIPASVIEGSYDIPVLVTDAQDRMTSGKVTLIVHAMPVTPTDTSIIGYAGSAPVLSGDDVDLVAVVVNGTGSTGAELTVTVDVSAIGGDTALAMVQGEDTLFYVTYAVPSSTAAGFYPVVFTVVDAENDTTGTFTMTLEVDAPFVPTNPQIAPSASPNPVASGALVTLHATVQIGTSPDSTGLVVSADLSGLGRAAVISLVDTGVSPDVNADDLIFTGAFNVSGFLDAGSYTIPVTVTDDQERTTTTEFTLFVYKPFTPPPIPNHPVSAMYDTLTHSTARITEGSTGKILRYVRDGLNAPLLQANIDHFVVNVYWESSTGPEIPIYTSGRLEPDAQNADGTEIIKPAVVVDGSSPSRAGHTIELMLDANRIGLKGGNAYRVQVQLWLVEPVIVTTVTIPLSVDEAYSA